MPLFHTNALTAVWGGGLGVLVGDKLGRPLDRQMQGKFALHMNDWWNTSLPDSGPWFFRPMTVDSPAGYEEDLLPRQPCFNWNTTTKEYQRLSPDLSPQCWLTEVSINETTGVRYGGLEGLLSLSSRLLASRSSCHTR